jgi:type IV pilus assembly protein PilA
LPNAYPCVGLHAGFWYRAAAFFIDKIILAAVLIVPVYFLVHFLHRALAGIHVGLLVYPAAWAWFALFESSSLHASPGKQLFDLQVVDEKGDGIGLPRAALRTCIMLSMLLFVEYEVVQWSGPSDHNLAFGRLLLALAAGALLMPARTPRKQALHDTVVGTFVVLKSGLKAFHEDNRQAMERGGARVPRWVAVLLAVPVFAILPCWFAYRAVHRFLLNDQILEASRVVEAAKRKAESHWGDRAPVDNAAAGLPAPAAIRSRYVKSLEVEDGTIIVTLGGQIADELQGRHLLFTATPNKRHAALLDWHCTSPDIPRYIQPIACL